MAQPQAYNRDIDFTDRDGDDTNHAGINAELDAAALSVNQIRDNLALIQKDDGSLANGSVGAEQLAPSAFDVVLGAVQEATQDAETAANNATLAASTAIAARDTTLAARDQAINANNAAQLNAQAAAASAAVIDTANFVQVVGNQSIAGVKTFSNQIVAPGGVQGNVTGNVTGNVDGNVAGNVTGNLTGNVTGNVSGSTGAFSWSAVIGGSGAPAVPLDVKTSGANALTSLFTTGLTDLNFRIGAMGGVTGGTAGTSQGKLGLFYLGTGEVATIDFLRGATATDGSFAFRTNGINRATLDNSGNFTVTGQYNGSGAGLTALPAAQLSGDVAAARITNALNASGSAPIFACRAWVNFNGTGTVAIRASGNVSSITDNGVGDYTVNFTTAMPDANYSVAGVAGLDGTGGNTTGSIKVRDDLTAPTTAAVRVAHAGSGFLDAVRVFVQIFR